MNGVAVLKIGFIVAVVSLLIAAGFAGFYADRRVTRIDGDRAKG